MQIGVLTLPVLCCPFIDHSHLVGGYIVQYEIGIERHGRNRTLIERERIVQLRLLLLTLKHFDHIELIDRHERRNAFTFTFNTVPNGQ